MAHVVTVFGSAAPQEGDRDFHEAKALGRAIGSSGYTVCNGGYAGTMAATALGAKEVGGATIGVTIRTSDQRANQWIDKEISVESHVERLLKLVEVGDAYVVLKGGTGTLLEFACVWELIAKKAMRKKPLILLGPRWPAMVRSLPEEEFTSSVRLLTFASDATECIQCLQRHFTTSEDLGVT